MPVWDMEVLSHPDGGPGDAIGAFTAYAKTLQDAQHQARAAHGNDAGARPGAELGFRVTDHFESRYVHSQGIRLRFLPGNAPVRFCIDIHRRTFALAQYKAAPWEWRGLSTTDLDRLFDLLSAKRDTLRHPTRHYLSGSDDAPPDWVRALMPAGWDPDAAWVRPPCEFTSEVTCSNDELDSPNRARFGIVRDDATRIMQLAKLCADLNLERIQVYDIRVKYEYVDPDAEEGGSPAPQKEFVTEGDRLNVSRDAFWYTGYLNNTEAELRTGHFDVTSLTDQFGVLDAGSPAAPDLAQVSDEDLKAEMRSRGLLDDDSPRMR